MAIVFHIVKIKDFMHILHFSQCSVTCGSGVQFRERTCRDAKGNEFDPNECSESGKPLAKTCTNAPCPKWFKDSFSEVRFKMLN